MFNGLRRLRADRRAPARRLVVEALEDRSLLSVFLPTNLVSDIEGVARTTDPNLVNPWGITYAPTGPFWVADNGMGVSTLYNGGGQPQSLVVTIPPPAGGTNPATPTGIVFNRTASDFTVSANGKSGKALFIFATEDGTISGWSPTVDATHAILEVDNSAVPSATNGAVYKGLALGSNVNGNFLFATNFRAGTIDVFDKNFKPVTVTGFTDPMLPAGFAPFGIANLGGQLLVTYAKQNMEKHDDVAGAGNGFIDVFDTDGTLVRRFASQGALNSPWGLAVAPAGFGSVGGDLLVGNFGDGRINAFNLSGGTAVGPLLDDANNPVTINGLWGLIFGNGASGGDANTLYFTAGIADEAHGLFGSLRPETRDEQFVGQVFRDLLHREADPSGLGFWSGVLSVGISRAQVVRGIESSDEYRSLVVQSLYTRYLHRSVDPGGLALFTTALANGATAEQVAAVLISSPEYFQNRGGGTNDGFLDALYQDALGRAVDPTGRAAFDQQLSNGGSTAQVAAEVLGSKEFQQDLVQSLYQQLLHRAADDTGLAAFTAFLGQGGRDEDVIAAIAGSPEYFGRLM